MSLLAEFTTFEAHLIKEKSSHFLMQKKRLFLYRDNGELYRIFIDDILYLETRDNYTRFYYYTDDYIQVRGTLEKLLRQLPEELFIRVHRSFAATTQYIYLIRKDTVLVSHMTQARPDRIELPVSRDGYAELMKHATIMGAE